MLEEEVGYPVQMISDEDESIDGVFEALSRGQVDMYPEVWLSEEGEKYDKYVRREESILSFGPLGALGRNGWYCLESLVERWPDLAGWRGLLNPEVRAHFNRTFYAFGSADNPDGWGPNAALLENLGIGYQVVYINPDEAETVIADRLAKNLPVLFFLW